MQVRKIKGSGVASTQNIILEDTGEQETNFNSIQLEKKPVLSL